VTELSPTLKSLLDLGFEMREPQYGMPSVGFRFEHLDLTASDGIGRYFHPVVFLSGVLDTGRILSMIESELPPDLETPEAAAAWTSYALKSSRGNLEPLPDWMTEGERHWELIPFVREQREYEARPRCRIGRDYARVLRRDLQRAFANLTEEVEMVVDFDGRVLSIRLGGAVYEVIAEGEPWSDTIKIPVSPATKLPARFTSSSVEVSYFGGHFSIGGYRYNVTGGSDEIL
jgi:hypothetical protein